LLDASYGAPNPYTVRNLLSSAFLMAAWLSEFNTSPVTWTLTAEVYFYLSLAVAFLVFKRISPAAIFSLTIFLCGVIVVSNFFLGGITGHDHAVNAIRHAGYNSFYVIYMLLGSCLFKIQKDRNNFLPYIFVMALLVAAYFLCKGIFDTHFPHTLGSDTASACQGLGFFLLALCFDHKIGVNRIANFFADISYPLYLVHVPFGWGMLFELTHLGVDPRLSIPMTLTTIVFMAWVLHVFIERPAHLAGKRWAARLNFSKTCELVLRKAV
ncbi:MAG: acyltransferase family protein, partial [Gammaproteobacteria bacterium]|nr:acyltransferase family protein [Gammaproteobacteria bacterium]